MIGQACVATPTAELFFRRSELKQVLLDQDEPNSALNILLCGGLLINVQAWSLELSIDQSYNVKELNASIQDIVSRSNCTMPEYVVANSGTLPS